MTKQSTFTKDGKTFPILEMKNKPDDKFGLSIGLSKARMILNNLDAIKSFVEQNSNGR